MLFTKDQRSEADLNIGGNAVVNTVLGQRVSVSALYV